MKTRTKHALTFLHLPGVLFILSTAGSAAAQTSYWTPSTSEEYVPAICASYHLANDISCSGRYCDNVRLKCVSRKAEGWAWVDAYWSPWFSEEGDTNLARISYPLCPPGASCGQPVSMPIGSNFHACHNGAGVVTGIRCKGKYCDNISLLCRKPDYSRHYLRMCSWTPYFSEEGSASPFVPGYNRVIVGIECKGKYCDNKRALICDLAQRGQACKYNFQCPAWSFCQYPEDSAWQRLPHYACGKDGRLGLCKARPWFCRSDSSYSAVGCNGKLYNTECHAHRAGVSVRDIFAN